MAVDQARMSIMRTKSTVTILSFERSCARSNSVGLILTVVLGSYDAWAAASMFSNSKEGWPTKTTCFLEGTKSISAAQHIRGTAMAVSFNLVSKTACITMNNNQKHQVKGNVQISYFLGQKNQGSRANQKMLCVLPIMIRSTASCHGCQSHKINHRNWVPRGFCTIMIFFHAKENWRVLPRSVKVTSTLSIEK